MLPYTLAKMTTNDNTTHSNLDCQEMAAQSASHSFKKIKRSLQIFLASNHKKHKNA